MKVHFNVVLDIIEVVHEIMFSVILDIISRSINLPVVSQTFSSNVKFDELLKLEVRAAISILEPIYGLSFNDKTYNHSSELNCEVLCVSVPCVHVDSSNESPESYIVKEIN